MKPPSRRVAWIQGCRVGAAARTTRNQRPNTNASANLNPDPCPNPNANPNPNPNPNPNAPLESSARRGRAERLETKVAVRRAHARDGRGVEGVLLGIG